VRAAIGSAIFFVIAPGSTAGLVPWLLTGWRHPDGVGVLDVVGLGMVIAGLFVAIVAFAQFVREGRGTPAPLAPTEELVVGGLYRYVRNPMYLAVAAMIAGQALIFRDVAVLGWLALFVAAVLAFVLWYEEPVLTRRFGKSYQRYRAAVPRWWPRRNAWRP
jgi:protein-S-isoprenylcysteine O-methyltransferase Ste14